MPESFGVGRGGRRPGAGRKPNPKPEPRAVVPGDPDIVAAELARSYTELAVLTLAGIAANGRTDAARVAAANSLLDRGHGKPVISEAAPLGKKEQRDVAAKGVKGRFAVRPPPTLIIDNAG